MTLLTTTLPASVRTVTSITAPAFMVLYTRWS